MAKQRQRGRPVKQVPSGERTQIGVILTGKTKALLVKAMKESGRKISREVEHLIEEALACDRMLDSMKLTLSELEHYSVEAALHRLGYQMQCQVIDGRTWKRWVEPS